MSGSLPQGELARYCRMIAAACRARQQPDNRREVVGNPARVGDRRDVGRLAERCAACWEQRDGLVSTRRERVRGEKRTSTWPPSSAGTDSPVP